MQKRVHSLLDLFFILSLIEGLAALGWLLSIPADPRNSIILGLSLQRLLLAAVITGGVVLFFGLIIFHRRGLASGQDHFDRMLSSGKRVRIFLVSFSILLCAGLAALWGLAFSPQEPSASFYRLAPLLCWLGLIGGQGLWLLTSLTAHANGLSSPISPGWVLIPLSAFVVGAFLLWFILQPDKAGLFLRADLEAAGLLIFLLFTLLFAQKQRLWIWVTLLASLLVFIVPLIGIWASGVSDLNFLIGLFPFNDAHGYYLGARRLADGATLNSFAAHRPLFPAFLGLLLGISGQNLQVSLLILTALGAISTFLFSTEIRATHGRFAAGLAFLLSFLFFRRFIGSTMTETLGFALGAAGFAVMWRSIGERHFVRFAVGLACLSIALNARAGPFFILPAVVLWAAWFFREEGRRFSGKVLLFGVLAATVGFAGNMGIFKAVANEDSAAFSNFSYTLYGTAVGGKGWQQIMVDHPEIVNLDEPELSNRVYSLAWDEIKQNPAGLLQGSIKAWKSLFSLDFYGMFGFVQGGNPPFVGALRLVFFLLSLAGFIGLLPLWKTGYSSFLLSSILGVWFSVPFVPPLDAEIRTYAAVIPLFILLVCQGVLGLARFLPKVQGCAGENLEGSEKPSGLPAVAGAAFTFLFSLAVVAGPLVIRATASPPRLEETECPVGKEVVYIRINPGSYIQIVDDTSVDQTWLPLIRWSDFSRGIHDFAFYDITAELDPISPPTTLTFAYDLVDGRHVWLIADTRLLPAPTGVFAVCGEWSKSIEENRYGFFYGDSFQWMDQGSVK